MPGPTSARVSAALRESPGLVPGLLVLTLVLYWGARDGGYEPLRWLAGAMFMVALVAVVLVAAWPLALPRPAAVALAALGAFTAWSYLSIAWAGVEADAWAGANKTLLYLLVFTLFLAFPWRPPAVAVLTGSFAVGVAAVGLVTMVRAAALADPQAWFVGGKLIAPITYANANVALYLIPFFPALFLAMRREIPSILRGVLLATAGLLPQLALVVQSRASLAALPVTLVLFFAVVPGRARSFIGLSLVLAVTAVNAGVMLDVYGPALTGTGLHDVLVDVRSRLLVSGVGLGLAGFAIGVVDRRIRVDHEVGRIVKIAIAVVVAVLALAAAAVVVQREGPPWAMARDWAHSFRVEQAPVVDPDTPYLASGLGGGRYDIWRVGWTLFREHPIAGIGVDNFAADHVRLRRQLNDSAYPHSLVLRVLVQTGIVGASLFAVFLGAAGVGVAAALRRGSGLSRGLAGATAAGVVYWLVHGSVEWFWEMPSLAALAVAFLAVATRMAPPGSPAASGTEEHPRGAPRLPSSVLAVAGAVAAVAALASLAAPWLATRDADRAVRVWRASPDEAFRLLAQARRLNPLSDEPDVLEGVIAGQLGRNDVARAAYLRAVRRDPSNWYPYLELSVIDAKGNLPAGRRWIAEARRLNPLEPVITVVQDWLRDGDIPTRDDLDRLLLSRAAHLQPGQADPSGGT